jgi:hypothetical protein
MRLSAFVKIYSLHDSGINAVHVSLDRREVIMELEMSVFDSKLPIEGKLIFTGVSQYEVEANNEDASVYGEEEIISVKIEKRGEDGKETMEIFALLPPISPRSPRVKTVRLSADDVVWVVNTRD